MSYMQYFARFKVPPNYLSINDLPNGGEIEVREAEKIVLQCQALSSKPATILKWYRKNIELMPESHKDENYVLGKPFAFALAHPSLYIGGKWKSAFVNRLMISLRRASSQCPKSW
ncbi:hypothetical protein TNCV_2421371 [Trichonephila clavipes]|nr:hypothetical protein TNCV_2421371 [Trichonephila clavipes]